MQEERIHDDEIDLAVLLQKLIKAIVRNRFALIIPIILGLILSVWIYWKSPKIYESRMILRSTILSNHFGESLETNLSQLLIEKNYTELSSRLRMTEEMVSSLKGFELDGLEKTKRSDGSFESILFDVSVEVTDNGILPDLEKGIVFCFEENEFVKKRINSRRQRYESTIDRINLENNGIDSLKMDVRKKITEYKPGKDLVMLDPSKVYQASLDLFKEGIKTEYSLNFLNGVEVVESFVPFKKPVKPRLILTLVEGLGLGLFIGIMLTCTIELRLFVKTLKE